MLFYTSESAAFDDDDDDDDDELINIELIFLSNSKGLLVKII